MPQQIGILDLGSNTARMIVMSFQPHYSFKLVDEVKESVRLVQGAGESNILQRGPVERATHGLKMFMALARAIDVPEVVGVATSALRDARNQADILFELQGATGLRLRVLSADEEAYYGYLGAVNSLPLRDGFVVDLGGGSAQITQVRGRGRVQSTSLPIGAVRMTERFIHSDPAAGKEWRALDDHLTREIARLDWFRLRGEMELVGMGGTVRNLANIDQQLHSYPLSRLHSYRLTRDRLEAIVEELRKRPTNERIDLPGLNDERADIILAGAAAIRAMMRHAGAEALLISGEGLREGVFYEHFMPGLDPPIIPDLRAFAVENLARNYGYQQLHVAKVRELALALFDQLQPLHGYGPWERELLGAGAMLHDIGVVVDYYDHHRHSAYIILHSSLPGYTHREIGLIALMARYHRKGMVTVDELRGVLDATDDQRVARLASLLRIAEYLERSKSQVVSGVRCAINGGEVRIKVDTVGDATVEIWDAGRRAALFRKAFGVHVAIQ